MRPDLEKLNREGLGIRPRGLGFLAVAAAAPAAGPAAPIVIGASVIGSAIAKVLGFGPPSSSTNYRPPANSKDIMVEFPAKGINIAFDMNDIGTALARGNKEADLRSYYSAFLSGSVDAGASAAAKRAILDAVRLYGVSVRDIAETLLTQAGVRKITSPIQQAPPPAPAQSFAQTPAVAEKPVVLPVVKTVLDSLLDLLKGAPKPPMPDLRPQEIGLPPPPPPAPGQTPGDLQAQNNAQAAIQAGLIKAAQLAAAALLKARQKVADQAQQFGCDPSAQYYDPATNSCVTLLQCPEGQYFEPTAGSCVTPETADESLGGIPIWLLLLLGIILISRSGDGGKTVTFRRRS